MCAEACLPDDFVLYTEWPEFLNDKMFPSWMNARWIGESPRRLIRGIGVLQVESCTSDTEPCLDSLLKEQDLPSRLIIWQRLYRTDIPSGWGDSSFLRTLLASGQMYRMGFTRIPCDEKMWSEEQRIKRRRWLRGCKEKTHRIDILSMEDFLYEYKRSDTWRNISNIYSKKIVTQKMQIDTASSGKIEYRAVRDLNTGEIIAGIATLDSEEHLSSYYFVGFISKRGVRVPAMTGLIDDWFERSTQKSFKSVQFGIFDSDRLSLEKKRECAGYSAFKAKFGTEFIDFPPPLFKFVRGVTG